MARRWLLAPVLLLAAVLWLSPWQTGRAFVATADGTDLAQPEKAHSVFHNKILIAARTGYPVQLMLGFCLFGNISLRISSDHKRYPNWIMGLIWGLLIYTYPASAFSEIVFQGISPRIFGNNTALKVFSTWFLLIQYVDPFYEFCRSKHAMIWITTWWLADATRVSLLTLERAVTCLPTLSRAMWQALFWCAIAPTVQCIEIAARGNKPPSWDAKVPNTLNLLKTPVLTMFLIQVGYLLYLMHCTDCNIFGGGLTMTECGDKYQDVYCAFTYLACIINLTRSYLPHLTSGEKKK